ncbi:MAG: aldehyde dehydrogenase family protein, partial [Spirillospora sp.]
GVHDELLEKIALLCDKVVLGSGFDAGTTMGPVISAQSRARIEDAIGRAVAAGATAVRDGRGADPRTSSATADGYFVGPTVLTGIVERDKEEIFGPVLEIHRAGTPEEAIALSNDTPFGNAATVYTRSGATARAFEKAFRAGNIGINAFPAPPANFTMGGLGDSFYGDVHICGDDPLRFYTEQKLVVSRW